jgi:TatD DNase family protein
MQFDVHTHSIDESSLIILNSGLGIPDSGYFSAGLHPWDAERFDTEVLENLLKSAAHPRCLAIGEIGLDKLRGPELDIQRKVFIEQAKIAEETNLPVIIHCVKAWNELREIKRHMHPESIWIYHGFSKTSLMTEVLIEGMIVSFGKDLLTNSKLQSAVVDFPLNKMLFETDDAKIDLNQVYEKVSELKKITLHVLEESIEENVYKIFPKWKTGLKELNY